MKSEADDIWSKGSVTIGGAKIEYGLGRSKLYELMEDGELPYSTTTGRRLIPRLAIERLLAAGMVGPQKAAGA